MKGIALALAAFVVFAIFAAILLRARSWKKHYKALLVAFCPAVAVYIWAYARTPADLAFLPGWLVEPCRAMDCVNGLLIFILAFHWFWDALYAAVITGFSAGLMVKIERSMPKGATEGELIASYKGGGCMDVIFARRMANLSEGGYATADGDILRLSRKGRVVARIALACKRLLNVGEGG